KDELPVDIPIESSVMMREQYEFQPVAFLAGMIEQLKEMDVQIYEQTTIKEVKEGSPVKLTTNSGYKINSGKLLLQRIIQFMIQITNIQVSSIQKFHLR